MSSSSMAKSLGRRNVLKAGAAIIAAPHLWVPARAQEPAWPTQTVGSFIEVETDSGRIRGGHSRGALAFKGIPYAGPVSGRNRFRAAPKVTPWAGVRDATRLGPPAMQGPGTTYGEHEPACSEDCLVLNVWTPAVRTGKRPVMFYCHGGGFTTGSGGQNIQDGARLAATYDVVVVAINHRLGLFGYLYLAELGGSEYATSGNQGMLDIIAALRWVRRNIANFGGDPDNVMLFGESGGGQKTSALMAMPGAHGLFHKAGIQSGAMLRGLPRDIATETARRLLVGLGLAPHEVDRLAEVPADKLIAIQLMGDQHQGPLAMPTRGYLAGHPTPRPGITALRARHPGDWGPVVDGAFLPRDPFEPDAPPLAAAVPLLIGNTRDEAVFFYRDDAQYFHSSAAELAAQARHKLGNVAADRILDLYRRSMPHASPAERAIAIETATFIGNNTALLADRKSLQAAPVYRYRDDFQSNVPIGGTDWTLRACHASDIAIVFYNFEMPDLQGHGPGLPAASRAMSGYFASFARSGVACARGQPAWPRYDEATREVMLLDSQCRVATDPNGEERRLWRELGWT
jgi:para-nitrobenzyl esterase